MKRKKKDQKYNALVSLIKTKYRDSDNLKQEILYIIRAIGHIEEYGIPVSIMSSDQEYVKVFYEVVRCIYL